MDQEFELRKQIFDLITVSNSRLSPTRFEKVYREVVSRIGTDELFRKKLTVVREIVDELEKERNRTDSEFKKSNQMKYDLRKKKEKYPYPYQEETEEDKEKKIKMPKIIRGLIQIDDFLRYVAHIAKFRKMPFDIVKMKALLMKSSRYRAIFRDQQTGMMNPAIALSLVEELIHASS